MYEDGLSQETKTQLLQFLEESRESARMEEEERKNLQRQEQRIMAETLSQSSMQKESDGSSGRCRRVEINVGEEAVVSRSAAGHKRQETEPGPSTTPRSSVASVIKSTSDHLARLHTQAEDEDEDLILLPQEEVDDPECQVIKTSNESPNRGMEALKIGKRKGHENVEEIGPTPSQPCPSPVIVSPVIGKSRTTSNNTITSTVMSDDDCDPHPMPPPHKSQKIQREKHPTPRVVLVPLSQTISLSKNAISSSEEKQTSPRSTVPTTNNLTVSHIKNTSLHNSPPTGKSSLQKNSISSPMNSPSLSEETVIFNSNSSSSSNLSPSGTPSPSKGASIHTSVKKSGTPNSRLNSMTLSTKRNIASYFKEDSNLSRNCTSPVSSSLGVSIIKSTLSTITTTTSDAAPATSTTITTTTSDKEGEEPENSPDGLPESDTDDKITLRTAVLRSINVFNPKSVSEVILERKQPFPSEAAEKCYYQGPNESQQQCRNRILSLMNDMRICLQHHQHTLPLLPMPLPVTVDWRLKHFSLDRTRPAPRRIAQRKQLDEEMQREEFKRSTRQTAKFSQEALDPIPGPSRTEGTTRGRRLGNGRTLGLRRGKKSAIIPLPKVTSDSDSDLEIGHTSPPLPSSSQSIPLPCPLKAGGIVSESKSKVESQPQHSRKAILLDSGSEGSDNECHVEPGAIRSDSNQCLSPEMQRDAAGSPSDPPSELCIIEDEQVRPKLGRPAIRRVARRGTRRPMPESTGSVPTKIRRTHTLSTENPTTDRVLEQTNQLSPDSSDLTPSFEDPSEWNTEQRQTQEDEQEGEKIPCPICQRLYPLQEIEVHASDCAELEDTRQQESNQDSRRLRRMNEESAAAEVSSSDKSKVFNKRQSCNLCKEILNSPEDLQFHIQSCHRTEEEGDEDDFLFLSTSSSSVAIRQINRRNIKVPGRTLTQEVAKGKRGVSRAGSLFNNSEDKPS
ncbi:flocculation protein FLO11-like isoform X2 [Portunus trituberculatus]|nr:flocculation protein FLO11-like isoform X2 [Portunus trituberculatus]